MESDELTKYLNDVIKQLKIRCRNAKSITVRTATFRDNEQPYIEVQYRMRTYAVPNTICKNMYDKKLCGFEAALQAYNWLYDEVYREFGALFGANPFAAFYGM